MMTQNDSLAGGLAKRLRALRAFSFPLSLLPVVAAAAAARPVGEWKWDILAASLAGVLLLHAAGNLLNDYFDFIQGVDRKTDGDERRPGRLLVKGELAPSNVLRLAFACLVLLAPFVAYLIYACGPAVIVFGAAAILCLYAYTGPPFKFKYRAMGELLIFLVFGPLLMAGAAWAQTGQLELNVLLLSIPVGLATTAVLVGNNIRDADEDRDARVYTLAHAAGSRGAGRIYIMLTVGAALGLAILACMGRAPWCLLLAPVTLLFLKDIFTRLGRGVRIADIDMRTARFHAALLIFLSIVLVVNQGW